MNKLAIHATYKSSYNKLKNSAIKYEGPHNLSPQNSGSHGEITGDQGKLETRKKKKKIKAKPSRQVSDDKDR